MPVSPTPLPTKALAVMVPEELISATVGMLPFGPTANTSPPPTRALNRLADWPTGASSVMGIAAALLVEIIWLPAADTAIMVTPSTFRSSRLAAWPTG